jgi:hypothetical protein
MQQKLSPCSVLSNGWWASSLRERKPVCLFGKSMGIGYRAVDCAFGTVPAQVTSSCRETSAVGCRYHRTWSARARSLESELSICAMLRQSEQPVLGLKVACVLFDQCLDIS